MRRTTAKPLPVVVSVVAVAVLGVLAALSGCGSGSDGKPASTSGSASASGPLPAATTATYARLVALDGRIEGADGGSQALTVESFIHAQLGLKACLHKAHIGYQLPAYQPPSDSPATVDWLTYGWQVQNIDPAEVARVGLGIAITLDPKQAQPGNVANPTPPKGVDRATYLQHLQTCLQAAQSDPASGSVGGLPYLARRTRDLVTPIAEQALESPSVTRLTPAYTQCLAKAGFPGITDEPTLVDKIGREYPRYGEPQSGPAFDRAVADERKAATAEAGCRRDIFVTSLAALAGPIATFESDHAADLSATDAFWQQTERESAALVKANPWAGVS